MSFEKVKKSVLQQAFDEYLLRKPRSVWSKALQWAPESHGISVGEGKDGRQQSERAVRDQDTPDV